MNLEKISAAYKINFGRVLIVDADSMACELLQLRLEIDGFSSDIITDGQKALECDFSKYDVVLVDLKGCALDGLMFTQTIKRNPLLSHLPVIMCSVKTSEDDILDAFDAGVDDFIAKPFSSRELVARIRAVIRRCVRTYGSRKVHEILRYKDLVLDVDTGIIIIGNEVVSLSNSEYILLRLLLRNRNSYFDLYHIRREAWCGDQNVSESAIATAISRLRSKLGDIYGRHIVCRHGIGYGFIE